MQMFSNVCGRPMAAPAYPADVRGDGGLDLPIWLHPYRGAIFRFQAEERSQFEIWWTFGWPYETSARWHASCLPGCFDRFPQSEGHHPSHGGDGAVLRRARRSGLGPAGRTHIGRRSIRLCCRTLKKRPLDYFQMFYADTALFGAYDATICGLKFFGAGHVLFASDSPFDPEKGRCTSARPSRSSTACR